MKSCLLVLSLTLSSIPISSHLTRIFTFPQLVSSLTHILHLSYPVNFNLTLASFEPSIQFTQSLLELTAQVNSAKPDQKPNFVFASSVATLANYPGPKDEWVPEESVELSSCLGGGYGESKRVCEDVSRISYALKKNSIKLMSLYWFYLSGWKPVTAAFDTDHWGLRQNSWLLCSHSSDRSDLW